jgi:prevent-host-death family protein
MQVSVREFKALLSHYLGVVRGGAQVEVTLHKRPVARVTAVAEAAARGPQRLVALGVARCNGGKPKGAAVKLAPGGTPVSALVLQGRG